MKKQLAFIFIAIVATASHSYAQQDGFLFTVVMTDEAIDGRAPVLLRWFGDTPQQTPERVRIYRKAGVANANSEMRLISETEKLRNIPLIRSIMNQPPQARAKDDLFYLLDHILQETVTEDSYVEQLFRVLDNQEENCDTCKFRRNLLVQANYGVAIVEGLGYVDRVEPGVYTYELRLPDGDEETVIGRATIDASEPTRIPPPVELRQVNIEGLRGDLRIYLHWDDSNELFAQRSKMFGYNLFRADGDRSADNFDQLLEDGIAAQINELPILSPAEDAAAVREGEAYTFVDTNQQLTDDGPVGEPFPAGAVYTYWVAARDLFGRNGETSQAAVAQARDQAPPQSPTGFRVEAQDTAEPRHLLLSWNRSSEDDVAGYRVYRYARFEQSRQSGPFEDIDGLHVGLLEETAQEDTDRIAYPDPGVVSPQHEGLTFWYTVSSVDEAGNESPQTPPVQGVLYDLTPPPPIAPPEICTMTYGCELQSYSFDYDPDNEADSEIVEIHWTVTRDSGAIDAVAWRRVEKEGANETTIELGRQAFVQRNTLRLFDRFSRPNAGTEVTYRFDFILQDGSQCGPYTLPDHQEDVDRFTDVVVKGQDLAGQIEMGSTAILTCEGPGPGERPHIPRAEGGVIPVTFHFEQDDPDQAEVILFRAELCDHFHPVATETVDEDGNIDVEDYYAPRQGGRVCYGYRIVDENGNTGPLVLIPGEFVFESDPDSRIAPILTKAEPVGHEDAPGVSLGWTGPIHQVVGYTIHFGTSVDLNENDPSVFLPPDRYQSDEFLRQHTASLFTIDDRNQSPILPDQPYWVRVTAVYSDGIEITSENAIQFVWLAGPSNSDSPRWPTRDMPPMEGIITAEWLLPAPQEIASREGMGIPIGMVDIGSGEIIYQNVHPPFICYRIRVDKDHRSYQQISGLVESIETELDGSTNSPFIITRQGALQMSDGSSISGRILYIYDDVNLIEGAQYRYKIVELDSSTGEIVRELGPTNAAEVLP